MRHREGEASLCASFVGSDEPETFVPIDNGKLSMVMKQGSAYLIKSNS